MAKTTAIKKATTAAPARYTDRVSRIHYLHQRSELLARMAFVYAVVEGHELLQAKKEIPRGGFMEFRQATGLSDGTIHNRMAIASMFMAKWEKDMSILVAMTEPGVVLDEKAEAILKKVELVTGGSTLTQLCLEWGIVKEAKPRGGHHPPLNPKSVGASTDAKFEAAHRDWMEACSTLHHIGVQKPTWQYLPPETLQSHADLLDTISKKMRKAIQKARK